MAQIPFNSGMLFIFADSRGIITFSQNQSGFGSFVKFYLSAKQCDKKMVLDWSHYISWSILFSMWSETCLSNLLPFVRWFCVLLRTCLTLFAGRHIKVQSETPILSPFISHGYSQSHILAKSKSQFFLWRLQWGFQGHSRDVKWEGMITTREAVLLLV